MFKKNVKPEYAAPQIKIVKFHIERGFAGSPQDDPIPENYSTTENFTEQDGGVFGQGINNNWLGN